MEKCEKSESHVNNAKLFWASVFFWLLACKQCEKPLDSLSERWAKHVLRMYWINWRLNESPCVNVTVLLIKQIVILRRLLIQPPPHVPFSLSFSHQTNAACVFVCFFFATWADGLIVQFISHTIVLYSKKEEENRLRLCLFHVGICMNMFHMTSRKEKQKLKRVTWNIDFEQK